MTCSKTAKDISRYIDGDLGARRVRRLEAHLAGCAGCRALLDDFRAIAGMARRVATPPVPDGSWAKIRARLRSGETPAPSSAPSFGRFRPAYGLAAAAVAAICLGALFFSLRRGPGTAPGPSERERYSLAKLDEAELYYQKAIKALSEAIAYEKGGLPPQVAEMFARNMEVVDASIHACRLAVRSSPDDVGARDFLLAAYRKKLVLMDDILAMNRNGFPGQEPGQAL